MNSELLKNSRNIAQIVKLKAILQRIENKIDKVLENDAKRFQ